MSIRELTKSHTAEMILSAVEPEEVFGSFSVARSYWNEDLGIAFRVLARVWNPDTAEDPVKAQSVRLALAELCRKAERKIADGTYGDGMPTPLKSKVLWSCTLRISLT
jgi:hypothetical protein